MKDLLNKLALKYNQIPKAQLGLKVNHIEEGKTVRLPDGRELKTDSEEYRNLYNQGILYGEDPQGRYYKQEGSHPEVSIYSKMISDYPFEQYMKDGYFSGVSGAMAKGFGQSADKYWETDPRYKEEYTNFMNNKYVQDYFQRNPQDEDEERGAYLNRTVGSLPENLQSFMYSNLNPENQETLWDDTKEGFKTIGGAFGGEGIESYLNNTEVLSDYEKKDRSEYLSENPVLGRLTSGLKTVSALDVPAKMIQSFYRPNYKFTDALRGKRNEAGMFEDIFANPLSYSVKPIYDVSNIRKFMKGSSTARTLRSLDTSLNLPVEVAKSTLNDGETAVKTGNAFLDNLHLGDRLWDGFNEVYPKFRKNSEKALQKGNDWQKKWYNHPETQARLQKMIDDNVSVKYTIDDMPTTDWDGNPLTHTQRMERLARVNRLTDDDVIKYNNDGEMWKKMQNDIANESYISQFQTIGSKIQHLNKNQPPLHHDNAGLSFDNLNTKRNIKYKNILFPEDELRANGRLNLVKRSMPYKNITSTAIHEGNHGIIRVPEFTKADRMLEGTMNEFATSYYRSPDEVYARIMQMRHHGGWKPGQQISQDEVNNVLESAEKSNILRKGFTGNVNPERLRKLINTLPAAGVGAGAAGVASQYQEGGQIDDVKNFYNEMINSKWYKNRLIKNGYEDVDYEVELRSDNASKATLKTVLKNDTYASRLINSLKTGKFQKPGTDTSYNNLTNEITLIGSELNVNPASALAHEVSHAEMNPTFLSRFESDLLTSPLKDKDNLVLHDKTPTERKADINAIRYNLYKKGLYDPETGEYKTESKMFDETMIEEEKNEGLMQRSRKLYNDDDLINLMNTIAVNKNDSSLPIAQLGGEFRTDGSVKGGGFYGSFITPSGKTMTEASTTIEADGKTFDIPQIVPGITRTQLDYLIKNDAKGTNDSINNDILQNAIRYNNIRFKQGQLDFATENEVNKLRLQLGGLVKKYQLGGKTSPVYKDLDDFYEKNRHLKRNGKKFISKKVNDESGEMDVICEVDMVTGNASNCTARANQTIDFMMPGRSYFESTEDTKKKLGVNYSKATAPTEEEKEKYIYFKGDTESGSFDAWDIEPVYRQSSPQNIIYSPSEEDRKTIGRGRLSMEELMKNYKGKIPLGSYITLGLHDEPTADGKGKQYVNKPSHSTRVVGFLESGEPLIADYGKIRPLSESSYMNNPDTEIYSITSIPGKEKHTFDSFIDQDKLFNTPNNTPYITDFENLKVNTKEGVETVKGSKKFKKFHDDIVENKNKVMAYTGMSSEDYDRNAKVVLALAGQETEFGQHWVYKNIKKLGFGDSKGVSSLRMENLDNNEGLFDVLPKNKRLKETVGTVIHADQLYKYLKQGDDFYRNQDEKRYDSEGKEIEQVKAVGFRKFRRADENFITNLFRGRRQSGYINSDFGKKDVFRDGDIEIELPKRFGKSKEKYTEEVNKLLAEKGLEGNYKYGSDKKGSYIAKSTDGNDIAPTRENLLFYGWQSPSVVIGGDADGDSTYYKNNVKNYQDLFGSIPEDMNSGQIAAMQLQSSNTPVETEYKSEDYVQPVVKKEEVIRNTPVKRVVTPVEREEEIIEDSIVPIHMNVDSSPIFRSERPVMKKGGKLKKDCDCEYIKLKNLNFLKTGGKLESFTNRLKSK